MRWRVSFLGAVSLIAVTLAAISLAGAVRAEIAGQGDPEFQAAVGDWLAGNEADALSVLAGLAAAGNPAAQVLLGQIDSFPALQGDWLGRQSRENRIAVLRAPGGVSGVRWTRLAQDPVAAAWGRLWDTQVSARIIVDFAALGEPRAARFAGLTLARRQRHGFAKVADDPAYPAALLAYAVREWQISDPARAEAVLNTIPLADPQRAVLGLEPDPAGFVAWAAQAEPADAVVALCAALCPEDGAGQCHTAALAGLGGYWGMMPLGSPVEALVSSSTFNRSERGLAATLHHMTGPTESACLNAALK